MEKELFNQVKKLGGTEENRQAADGSVADFCLFSDRNECDEWAYFRGECKLGDSIKTTETVETHESTLQPGTEAVSDWWGTIKSTPADAQYNDFFGIWSRQFPMGLIQ